MTVDDEFQPHDHAGEFSAAVRCIFCGAAHRLDRAIDRDDECARCASPLYPAERHRLEYSGQRMLARVAKQGAVEVFTAWPQKAPLKAEMRDLSLNGMQLVAPARLAQDQLVKIVGDDCIGLGRVAHCGREPGAAERWLVGIEFLTLRFTQHTGTFVSLRV
jgi:hypothetical protein